MKLTDINEYMNEVSLPGFRNSKTGTIYETASFSKDIPLVEVTTKNTSEPYMVKLENVEIINNPIEEMK